MRLAQHRVPAAVVGAEPDLRVPGEGPPLERLIAGGEGGRGRHEQPQPAFEPPRAITARRSDRGPLHRFPKYQGGVGRGGAAFPLGFHQCQFRADVRPPSGRRPRHQRPYVPGHPLELLLQPRSPLVQRPRDKAVARRKGRAEQGDRLERRAGHLKPAAQLERGHAARAVSRDHERAGRGEGANLFLKVRGEVLDALEWTGGAVEPGGLQPVERLILSEVAGEGEETEHVPVVTRHAEDGRRSAAGLQRHNGARPARRGAGGTEEGQDFPPPVPQHLEQGGGQNAGRSIAFHPVPILPDTDAPAAQLREQRDGTHSSTSTRSPVSTSPSAPRGGPTTASVSIASARPAAVCRSNRRPRGTSLPDAPRRRITSRAAMSESPPRSKKLSSTPASGRRRTSRKISSTMASVGVRASEAAVSARASGSGSGRARRSSLPLAVRGSASSMTNWAGIMYSGSSARSAVRRPSTSAPAPESTTR